MYIYIYQLNIIKKIKKEFKRKLVKYIKIILSEEKSIIKWKNHFIVIIRKYFNL